MYLSDKTSNENNFLIEIKKSVQKVNAEHLYFYYLIIQNSKTIKENRLK